MTPESLRSVSQQIGSEIRLPAVGLPKSGGDQLAAISRISQALLGAVDPTEVLDRALVTTIEVMGGAAGTVHEVVEDPDGKSWLRLMATRGLGLETIDRLAHLGALDEMGGSATFGGEPISIGKGERVPAPVAPLYLILRQQGLQALLSAPLVAGDRLLGVITIGCGVRRKWNADDAALLVAIANQTTLAFANARLFGQTHQALAEQIAVSQASAEVYRQMATNRELIATLLNSLPVGIAYLDRDLVVRRLNPLFAEYLGVSVARAFGECCSSLLGPAAEPFETTVRQALASGQAATTATTTFCWSGEHAGSRTCWNLKAVPIVDGAGAIEGVLVLIEDVTREQEIEALRNEFLSIAAHELRTPLASVKAYAQLTGRRLRRLIQAPGASEVAPDLDQLSTYLGVIDDQANRLSTLVSELLTISRLQTGQIELNRQHYDLGKLIGDSIERLRSAHDTHTVSYHRPAEPICADCDSDRIDQVLMHLVSNAVTYSPIGSEVTVSLCASNGREGSRLDPGRRYAIVSVQDRGVGIAPRDLPYVFDRYFRGGHSDVRHYSGFGLGLYLAAEIVRRHGGDISAESEVGKGSVFTFALPLSV